jgi:hypothetical protein
MYMIGQENILMIYYDGYGQSEWCGRRSRAGKAKWYVREREKAGRAIADREDKGRFGTLVRSPAEDENRGRVKHTEK